MDQYPANGGLWLIELALMVLRDTSAVLAQCDRVQFLINGVEMTISLYDIEDD